MQHDPQRTAANFRRESFRQIGLPFLGGVGLLLAVLVITLLLPSREHVAAVANCMTAIFLLCPAILCIAPLYFLVAMLTLGMNGAIDFTGAKLQTVERWVYGLAERVGKITDRINRTVLEWRVRFAPLEKWLSVFEHREKHK
jgi:hypothetical protein